MDRVLRIVGVVGIVMLVVGAYRAFDGAVGAESSAGVDDTAGRVWVDSSDGVERAGASSSNGPVSVDINGDPPRYLAFTATMPSRTYRIASVGQPVADWNSGGDYPLETDLFPAFSLVARDPIEPGLYASAFTAVDCSYQLQRLDRDGQLHLIGEDRLADGRMLVSINEFEPDSFTPALQCGPWAPWSPVVEPLSEAGNGDYWVGDLAPGTWSIPEGCLWEEVVSFRGARLSDVTESGIGPAPLVVDDDTLGVRVRRCDTAIRLTTPEPEPELGFEPGLEP